MARGPGAERGTRAGTWPLRLLADPINAAILREIGSEEIGAEELATRLRHASRSTRFSRLRRLEQLGLLVRETLASVPRRSRYRLTHPGRDLLPVAERIEDWLRRSPRRAGKSAAPPPVAVRGLAIGWNTEVLHRLGERPHSLAELAGRIEGVSYDRLRHALRMLHSAGLVGPSGGVGHRRRYRLTHLAREATAPIALAIRWDERHLAGESASLTAADVEALLLLPAPLIKLPGDLNGTCGELLDQSNIRAVCSRAELASKSCPKASIYGSARAWSPLLAKPLQGPVYLGVGFGHELPDLVADLNGQIRVLLHARIDRDRVGGIRSTFEVVPDAPVTRFVLKMRDGRRKSLIEDSGDVCLEPQRAFAKFVAHNGLLDSFRPTISTSCRKADKRPQRRAGP
jgi:DNA-binding HxlR family transcriptional regulator